MRTRTVRLRTTRTSRISLTTAAAPLHCGVCGHDVGTVSVSEAEMIGRLIGRSLSELHLIAGDGGITRVCRDSITNGGSR